MFHFRRYYKMSAEVGADTYTEGGRGGEGGGRGGESGGREGDRRGGERKWKCPDPSCGKWTRGNLFLTG